MLIIITIFISAFFAQFAQGQLLVTLPKGQILGHELQTFTNRPYYAYQSIPYAAAPLGELRFQAPEEPESWEGVLDAAEDSHMCYQMQYDGPEESEDCLYINVFTPVLNREVEDAKLPVIFWIYGGGLRNGAARFEDYRPDYWMDEDVILVTHNYRVGIFGFLSTGDSIIPGNNGLKDQNLALKWTHENIHLFGGDADRITVHGQSAGAVSASYHLLIKQSAGLFRSVIAESGSPLNMYSFIENPKEYAIQLAQAINPDVSSEANSEEIRDFLVNLDGQTIDNYSRATAIAQPAVVIEPEGPTAVVTKEMYEMLESGEFHQVPVLMGIRSEEALFIAKSENYLIKLGRSYDANEALVVPDIFPHDENIDRAVIGDAVKLVYLNEEEAWAERPGRVVRHFSDQRFARGIIKQGKLISQYAPVYFYQFSYDGDVGGWNVMVEDAETIQHAEELYYVFLNRSLSEIDEGDALTHKRLVRLWSNFVKFQNPTPEPDDLLENIEWPAATPVDYKYLNINNSLSIELNPKDPYFSKWEYVFETYGRRPFSTF
uniref:Carboxylic ester hydrolase n=1 Tax=Dendroctonus armandi TaxID=77159 RepID=A0A3G2KX76_9CUCU|nr:carboxylesterase [Dendroctonus armandi]